MTTPTVADRILAIDVATVALIRVLGRTDHAVVVREHLRIFRREAAAFGVSQFKAQPEGVPASSLVEVWLRAGGDWHELVAAVNTVADRGR